ncbi:hypothetical protein RND71_029147 [Anisodus tanguticus]|uniref:Uncharacterized protein n=1 Tax=Anisodus tanguticus TaxID=243964 RepID=A0AAE1REK7_9SOLA|nr:hypothetical protein RND71_029147 [Anisodus tanguticus]
MRHPSGTRHIDSYSIKVSQNSTTWPLESSTDTAQSIYIHMQLTTGRVLFMRAN